MRNIHNILITGGAGFIGSHLADSLIKQGYNVRVLDNLESQVHGPLQKIPDYLNKKVGFTQGSILEPEILRKSLQDMDAVFHFAANVGVGQSMYQIPKYISTNTQGTANLLDILVNEENSIQKVILASSMSIYGEGKYHCANCGDIFPVSRDIESLKARQWEICCSKCGKILKAVPTDENKPLNPTSIYAQSKRHQEEMILLIGKTYGIPMVALRLFNVYGTRQALSNPYTGVCAIFSSRLKNKLPPVIYEDGLQSRDFIHVKDVASASILALEKKAADGEVFNVGTGSALTILDVARILTRIFHLKIKPQILNQFRKGDIRHCFADITKIQEKLGFQPIFKLESGFKDVIEWVNAHPSVEDKFQIVESELEKRGLKSN